MTTNRALVLLLAAVLTGGCSTRVRDTDSASDFADQFVRTPTVGIAAVTVDPQVDGVFTDADQADAADALLGAFLSAGEGVEIWHEATVWDLGGAEILAVLRDEYTRLGRLRPDQVRSLAVPLEGCRYLAFGRLTEDRVRTHAQEQTTSDPEARAEGLAEHGDPWTAIVSVERQARVTVEIFDLASGESVWRAEATSREKQLYEYEDEGDPVAELQQRLAAADGPTYLSRHGEALKLPDLIGLMRKAFRESVQKLPVERK